MMNGKKENMSKKDLIVSILDRSGSMSSIINDSIGGYNTFIADQRTVGNADVTLVLFDHERQTVYRNKDINTVEELTRYNYVPRGSTALLDAIGHTINWVGAELATRPETERPNKVVVCILTDGMENSSLEFTNQQIKDMVQHQTDVYNWGFIFLGANMDAFDVASSLGISRDFTANFAANREGTQVAYATMSNLSTVYRTSTDNLAYVLDTDTSDEFKVQLEN